MKFKMQDKGTVLRTIFYVLALSNYIVSIIGKYCWGTSIAYEWTSFAIFLLMSLVTYWYNNNWTGFASLAEDVLDMLKDGKITNEELQNFLAKHKTDDLKLDDKNSKEDNTDNKGGSNDNSGRN